MVKSMCVTGFVREESVWPTLNYLRLVVFSLDELKNSIKDLSKEWCQNLPYYSFPKSFHDHHSYALADVSNCFVTIFEHTFYYWFRSSDDLFLRLILC